MTRSRPFRFCAGVIPVTSRYAQKVEALGYATLCIGDHPSLGDQAPFLAFLMAVGVTTTLRFASHVLNITHGPRLFWRPILEFIPPRAIYQWRN